MNIIASPIKRQCKLRIVTTLLIGTSLLGACQSDSNSQKQQATSNTSTLQPQNKNQAVSILNHLPKETVAFMRINFESKFNQETFLKNLEKSLASPLSNISGLELEQNEIMQEVRKNNEKTKMVLEFIKDSGLLPYKNASGAIERGTAKEVLAAVGFEQPSAEKLRLGVLVKTDSDAQAALKVLEEKLLKKNLDLKKTTLGFFVQQNDVTIDFKAKDNNLAIGIQPLPGSNNTDNMQPNFADDLLNEQSTLAPIIKTLNEKLPNHHSKPTLAFIDFKEMTDTIPDMQKVGLNYGSLQVEVENDLTHVEGAIHFNMEQTPFKEQLKQLNNGEASTALTASAATEFNLSETLINLIRSELKKNMEKNAQPELAAILPILQTIGDLKLGLAAAGESSPFPELFITSATSSGDQLASLLEIGLSQQLSAALGQQQWQTKKINSQEVKYVNSPFGVGLFLANTANKVIISSGETGINSILEGKPLDDKSQKALSQRLNGVKKSLLSYYLHGPKLAAILEDVSQTVAPFTGGQAVIDQDILKEIRQSGESAAAFSAIEDGVALDVWTLATAF